MNFALIVLLFIASGFSSLIYQVVWTRLLVFVFGSTTFATATVLSVFMGGLALGSFLAGRIADKIKRPFLWYGILEGVIGIWALLAPFLFDAATPIYRFIWQNFHLSPLPFGILRFFAALVILLIPTTCMGATLPLLAKYVTDSLDYVGKKIGTLYAANTLGAVAGAAVAGLVFLPSLGLNKTTFIAALINFALIIIVVLISQRVEAPKVQAPATADNTSIPEPSGRASNKLSPEVIVTMGSFALSGAVAMIYEVGWTRTLLMVIGSSTYAFTLMLTSFLLGIFFGSLVSARLIDKAKDPLAWLAILQFLIGAASLFCMGRFNSIPYWNLQLNAAFPNDPNTALAARFFVAASIMMPLTFLLGAVFPAAVKICVKDLSAVGRSVGSLYSCNTIGAIIGAFLAGFVLVPLLGVEKSLIAGTVINIGTGVLVLFYVRSVRKTIKVIALVAATLVTANLLFRPEIWDREVLVLAQTARRYLVNKPIFNSIEAWRKWISAQNELQFYQDGASSTVGLLHSTETGKNSLVTNGHMDASDDLDMSTQVLLAAAPIAANPGAKDVAVIGWGSGVTVGTAARMTDGRITAIELEPAVIKTSPYFHHVNKAPETDPRVHVEVNDGRNFLLATDQKFDVIVSEPSNPWQAGVCNLFTRQYFKLCKDRLRPGGVFGLWCQTAEVPGQNIRGIFSALHEFFPYCAILRMDQWDIVGLASDKPITVDVERLREIMRNKEVVEDLKLARIESPEGLMARFCVAPTAMEKFIDHAIPNDDDTNRLEYDVGRTYENQNSLAANTQMFNQDRGGLPELLNRAKQSPKQTADAMCAIARQAHLDDNFSRSQDWLQASTKIFPTGEAYRLSGINQFQAGDTKQAYILWNKALELEPRNVETLQTIGLSYSANDPPRAREAFKHVLSIEPNNALAMLRIAETYGPSLCHGVLLSTPAAGEDPAAALRTISPILNDKSFFKSHPGVLYLAGWANYKLGNMEESLKFARKFSEINRSAPCSAQLLAEVYSALGQPNEAKEAQKQLHELGRKLTQKIVLEARGEIKDKLETEALKNLEAAVILNPVDREAVTTLEQLSKENRVATRIIERIRKQRKQD